MALTKLSNNRAVKMLDAARKGGYGVLGVVVYNMEALVAIMKAAEAKRSPVQILLFPWAYHYSPLLIDFCAHACRKATVPITIHMDPAQDPEVIKQVAKLKAEDGTPALDSIMVDMSHYEKEENLAKTRELVAICHAQGISTEGESGRIEGGEDGVADTADLEGMMTTEEDVDDFLGTAIDFLAPAFGNIHGEYGGVENIKLDYERLEKIQKKTDGKAQMVLHGTNGFPPDIVQKCIKYGITRINVNKIVMDPYFEWTEKHTGKKPLTELVSEGTALIQKTCEEWMDHIGSSGKA